MDVARLVESSISHTGLDDFGGDSFREGLDVLAKSLSEEAELGDVGRMVALGHLRRLLSSRLRVEDCYRQNPEIELEETPAPIFILGLPRTGTTALSTRLARDPDTRSLLTWESMHPTPPPEAATRDTDPRIERARSEQELMYSAFPEMKKMYDASPTDPTECQDLLGMEFKTYHFSGQYWAPGYAEWVIDQDMTSAYRYHQRTLKLLQWHCPPNRWHLKTPVHMLSLEALNEVYPDARFIMTHRDPAAVLGSVCALIQVTRSMASGKRDPKRIGNEQIEFWPLALERAMAFRERIGEDRFADVFFTEQLEDPVGVVANAYQKLGLAFTGRVRDEMSAWAQTHQRGRHGSYTYTLEDYGLNPGHVRERFRSYIDRFAVDLEEIR